MFRFRRCTDDESVTSSLVADECESFLAGRYLVYLLSRGLEVPPWAWFNSIAHGSPEYVTEIAASLSAQPSDLRVDQRAWRLVISAIADKILDTVDATASSIAELQQLMLIPIEFALMANPVGPRTALQVVERALERS